jgi:hypothetical protein
MYSSVMRVELFLNFFNHSNVMKMSNVAFNFIGVYAGTKARQLNGQHDISEGRSKKSRRNEN